MLKQDPHPNICVYYGCVRNDTDDAYFTHICLKKYVRTLGEAVRSKDSPLDRVAIINGLSNGLQFLHTHFKLAHNDINPHNIMLDDQGNAVIIDFDSCMPLDEDFPPLKKRGTFHGWTKCTRGHQPNLWQRTTFLVWSSCESLWMVVSIPMPDIMRLEVEAATLRRALSRTSKTLFHEYI